MSDRPASRRTLVVGIAGAAALAGAAVLLAARASVGARNVVLTNQLGEEVRWGSLDGEPRALFFGFTHCPVICPVTVYELTAAMDAIGAVDLKIDFVTVDPERDTPERLREYFSGFGPRVRAYTGAPHAIAQVARAYEVVYQRQNLEGGDYTMDHTATVFLLDARGRVADVVAYGTPAEILQQRLRALTSGAS